MPDRTRYATWLALALIALGAWRVLAVVGASPLLGYGDQYDMRRTSACVGLWPDLSPVARQQAHPETPTARYVRGDRAAAECYPSSELLFVAPVAATLAPSESVDLRVIGVLKATILIVLALAFALMLRRRPAFGLAHAIVFAVVIADPMVTLWINTLYTEFAALLFAYASVVLLIALGSDAADAILRSRVKFAALMVALAGLGFSRQQHMLLPALLVLPLLASLWTSNRRMALTLLAGVCAIAFAQMFFVARPATIAQANSVDVVLGAILPASRDESATARKLGLPDRCLRSVGASWYVTMGESLAATCPEALAVPKRRVALLAFTEPTTLLRMILRAVPHLQDWRLGYLGRVEGIAYGGGDAMREVAGPIAASIASWEPLSLYYPNYPDVDAPGFIAAIPAAFFRPDEGGGETRTFIIAATGARTEIDRRRITMGTP